MTNNKLALVIEDDALNLLAITSLLTKMQIRYKRNTTGAQVIQQARDLQPDFILLDMDLPAGDPFMICAELHADLSLRHIPVIATSDANMMFKLMPRIRICQFAGFIPKPLSQQDLDRLLHKILGVTLI
jgi:CheY-like chemotaxis protein